MALCGRQQYFLVLWQFVFLCFSGVFGRNASHHHRERNFTVGVFLRKEGAWSSLEKMAREITDPRSASYGQYLDQAQLTQSVGISKSEAEVAATSLRSALEGACGNLSAPNEPYVVTHRDAVVMTVQDYFATYHLGQALTENLSNAWPKSVHMLVTPPMPDGVCSSFAEEECKKRKPCKWHDKEMYTMFSEHESKNESKKNHSHQAHKATCTGGFAGWICWREALVGVRSEAQWHCFEPADFKGVKPSNSSNVTGSNKATAKRRRRGVQVLQILEHRMLSEKIRRFHAVARSGGFSLMIRGNNSWRRLNESQSLEITFRQDDLIQNRLLKHEDFILQGRLHIAAVNSLKNLRHVSDIFVCFNSNDTGSFSLAPPGQAGCDCEPNEANDNETKSEESWGWDSRLGRDCERVWSFGPRDSILLPRAPQSLDALHRDLQVLPGDPEMSTQAVAQFNDEAFMQEDVTHLHHAYGLPVAKTVHVHGVRGKKDNSDTGGEGSLDLQTITALAPSASTTWWGVDPWVIDGFMLAYAVDVNDHSSPPLVHSISWGDAEALYPAAFVQRLDYELMKLTLRGVTLIVASGDNGNSAVGSECDFVPDVVGSSPWVTSVGATMPSLDSKPYCSAAAFEELGACEELGQVTCSSKQGALITSSGYFSVYRPRPRYQDAAVQTFLETSSCKPFPVCPVNNHSHVSHDELEKIKAPCQHISKFGCSLRNLVKDSRASPDVALPGQNYPVLVNHSVFGFDGTSASAPALAALVARLNGQQRRLGQPPLGLLNPWLYQVYSEHPQAFLDVVVGDTASTETRLCPFGFVAAPGWDPATGLGVPRFSTLQKLLPRSMKNASCDASPPSILLSRTDIGGSRFLSLAALLATCIGGAFAARALTKRRASRDPWQTLTRPFLDER